MKKDSERRAGLAFLPIATTFGFYVFPPHWQSSLSIQFIPQLSAYVALGLWAFSNNNLLNKLGLETCRIAVGVKWGTVTGILLGCLNAGIILYLIPAFGGEITFLRDTPHAQLPFWVMVPWFILFIACAVELNFRGFLLGRLLVCCSRIVNQRQLSSPTLPKIGILLSLLLSALTFSFDPFMVATFGSLHWIAVWDGLIWGWMWIRLTNLYAVITAHAVEVLILYLTIRAALL
jgi:membrane protease YdiL (CAAX protease family)